MSLVKDNARLGGFTSSVRTLLFRVSDLQLDTAWTAEDVLDPDNDAEREAPAVCSSIKGKAMLLQDDHLVLIGSPKSRRNSASFVLCHYEDRDRHAKRWQVIRDNFGYPPGKAKGESPSDDDKRFEQYLSNVFQRFEEKAPTASVGITSSDWDLEWQHGTWNASCDIPRSVFEALLSEIRRGACCEFNIAITLLPTLVPDGYRSSSEGTDVGVLPLSEYQSQLSHGWTEYIHWHPSLVERPWNDQAVPSAGSSSQESDSRLSPVPPTTRELEEVARQIANHSRILRNGFIALIVAMLIAAML